MYVSECMWVCEYVLRAVMGCLIEASAVLSIAFFISSVRVVTRSSLLRASVRVVLSRASSLGVNAFCQGLCCLCAAV